VRAVAILLALLPMPALALSCMPWDVENAFSEAVESNDAYVVVSGDLRFDPDALPVTDWANQMDTPPSTSIPAHLDGMSLTAEGFNQPFDLPVTLKIGCAGPWCASAKPGPSLAFLKATPDGWVLEQGACGGFYFGAPEPGMLDRVKELLATQPSGQ
jgi:hypothetical protein